MNEDYKEKLLRNLTSLNATAQELEKIIILIKDSNNLEYDTKTKAASFLEGYMMGLQEQIEWLNYINIEKE